VKTCSVCGGQAFRRNKVLWKRLVEEWQIDPTEEDYIDRQQGEQCTTCGANLRSIVLAMACNSLFRTAGPLAAFVSSPAAARYSVLELNTAGSLHSYLKQMKGHVFGAYPEVDMHALPYPDRMFDAVVHSDTLEHVTNPVHALRECLRVLKNDGAMCFTVPIIVGRLSRGRAGLPRSFHGNPQEEGEDWAVQTEFGADAWVSVIRAGFSSVLIHTLDFPAAIAMTAFKTD
jgi:SAM-dependent methyltransferase